MEQFKLDNYSTQKRPAPVCKPLLCKGTQSKPRIKAWNHKSIADMLAYLQGTSRPGILIAVHQGARFSSNPRLSHERAITRVGRHLIGARDKGLICKVDKTKVLECFVDAGFAGGWSPEDPLSPENVL